MEFFPIEFCQQETDKWINPHQEGYEKPLLDKQIQQSYLKNLHERFFGTASPWDQGYVKQVLQTDIWASEKKQLTIFSNQDDLSQSKWYGLNFRPYPHKKIQNIADTIPLDELKILSFHKENRAITIKNLTGRSLPTTDIYVRSIIPGYGYPLDKLQASSIFIGTPIYVINQTKDKRWSLVITPDFIVWVESDGIAYTNDNFIEKWKSVAKEKLAAIIQTDTALVNQQGRYLATAYIGALFPARSAIMEKLILSVPIADKDGNALLSDVVVHSTQAAYIPIKPSPKNFAQLINSLKGRPYGWGGLSYYNDCSAELKCLFLPFGIWLPRQSYDQIKTTAVVDLSVATPTERLTYLIEHGKPFFTIMYIKGHIFLYLGNFQQVSQKLPTVMSYQNVWGLANITGDKISIIGEAVFLPLLLNYPEDPSLNSLLSRDTFQVSHLNQLPKGYPKLMLPYVL